jgi:hypothetical protein
LSILRRLFERKIGLSENAVDSVPKPGSTGSADSHSKHWKSGASHLQSESSVPTLGANPPQNPNHQIEVPNRWGEGDGTPLVVEQHPNLERIFTDPHPPLPQRLTKDNRKFWEGVSPFYVRQALAAAYLLHPDPTVRLATVRLTKDVWSHSPLPQALTDTLADPSQDVRFAAAQVIWDLSPDAKLESKVTFALACLRDEIERTGIVSTMTQAEAQQGLEVLRNCRPDRRTDFNRWIIYVWCRRKEDVAEHGYRLLDIYGQQDSFLGAAEEETRHILGITPDLQMIYHGIRQALGASAARELKVVWDGIRKSLLTFNEVKTREVTKATDALFNEALHTIPPITPRIIVSAYKGLRNVWTSQALYSGTTTQMRDIVSHNLGLLAQRTDFISFLVQTGMDNADKFVFDPYVQVNAICGGTFVGIRLWRSPDRIFACGNASFQGPQEAVFDDPSFDDREMLQVLHQLCQAYAENNRTAIAELEPRATEIGEKLNRRGGLEEMRRIFEMLGGIRGTRTLEMHWSGIGDWWG